MATKLTDFQTPTGAKGNVLSINSWISMILGGVMLIFTFAAAQNVASKVQGKVPYLDGTVEQPWRQQQQSNQKKRNIF